MKTAYTQKHHVCALHAHIGVPIILCAHTHRKIHRSRSPVTLAVVITDTYLFYLFPFPKFSTFDISIKQYFKVRVSQSSAVLRHLPGRTQESPNAKVSGCGFPPGAGAWPEESQPALPEAWDYFSAQDSLTSVWGPEGLSQGAWLVINRRQGAVYAAIRGLSGKHGSDHRVAVERPGSLVRTAGSLFHTAFERFPLRAPPAPPRMASLCPVLPEGTC